MPEKTPQYLSRYAIQQPAAEQQPAIMPQALRTEIDRRLGRHLIEAQRKEQSRRTIK
jgi:hypothetical protein